MHLVYLPFSRCKITGDILTQLHLPDDRRQALGCLDSQLLVDVHPAEYDLNIPYRHVKLFSQKPDHMISRFPGAGHRCNTNAKLMTFYLADGITFGIGSAEDVQHQGVTFP